MTNRTPFADLIINERLGRSMTQAVLAAACGVTERTIIRVESGGRPSPETVMALGSVLHLPMSRMTSALAQSSLRIAEAPEEADSETSGEPDCGHELMICFPAAYDEEATEARRKVVREIAGGGYFGGVVTSPDHGALIGERLTRSMSAIPPREPTFRERLDMATMGPTGSQRMLVVILITAVLAGIAYAATVETTETYRIVLAIAAPIALLAAFVAHIARFKPRKAATSDPIRGSEADGVYHLYAGCAFYHGDNLHGRSIYGSNVEKMTIETTGDHIHCRFVTDDGAEREIRFLPNLPPIMNALREMERAIQERHARADAFMESYAA